VRPGAEGGFEFMPHGPYRLRKVSPVGSPRTLCLVLGLSIAGLILVAIPGQAVASRTITYPFIAGSFVVPMD